MIAPDAVEVLQRRMSALEAEHFALLEKLRRISDATERNAHALDDLEEVLTDVSVSAAENTAEMAAVMAYRQAQLDNEDALLPAASSVPGPGPGSGQEGAAEAPDLAVLHAWVEDHIAPMVRKTTTTGEGGGIRWCQQWWEHGDAVERFAALYLAFSELSQEESATWLSVYLRDHLDPHMSTLTSPYGPFYACSRVKHSGAIEPLGHLPLSHGTAPQPSSPDLALTHT